MGVKLQLILLLCLTNLLFVCLFVVVVDDGGPNGSSDFLTIQMPLLAFL